MSTQKIRHFKGLRGTATLYLGDCLEILPTLDGVDAVISDPPFSARTHETQCVGIQRDGVSRSAISYSAWSADDVSNVVELLNAKAWVCIFSDHILQREWEDMLRAKGRYVFAPIPCVTPGRSVRLTGDGPSSWTDWLTVSRTKDQIKWGTLRGFYEGKRGQIEHMGGKPIGMMGKIVEDYSREGDTVLDFCMGAATTGVACLRTGRNFIGIEIDPKHYETACERMAREIDGELL